MRCQPLSPVGATVDAIALSQISAQDAAALRQLLGVHGVLIFPGQNLDDTEFTGFLRRFGPLTFTEGETPVPGHPDLNVVSNVGRATPPRSQFHVDTSYIARPPVYTALRAVTIPDSGGATQFTNQYRAFDTLPDATRAELAGRTVTHVLTGVRVGPDAETSAEHPVFLRHPESGRTALYLSTPERCRSVSGCSAQDSAARVASLLAHSTRPDNVLSHTWSPGDVVMWDNRCVLHRADHAGVIGGRVLHRGMVSR